MNTTIGTIGNDMNKPIYNRTQNVVYVLANYVLHIAITYLNKPLAEVHV